MLQEISLERLGKLQQHLWAELARESDSNGHHGRIILNAIPDAVEFYQKIGFVETGEGSLLAPEMELTPTAARQLMNKRL